MASIPLSIGKLRGLQQCSTPDGAIAVLALDHRNNLRKALNPQAPDTVSDADLTAFKQEVVGAAAEEATAVLLDPEVGAAQCIASGAMPGSVGLVVAVEATGYTGDPTARHSAVLEGWSVAKVRRMGASAVKLLVYYHPDAPTAGEIEAFVQQVADDCRREDVPLLLEPLSYPLDPAVKSLPSEEKKRVVIETARRLVLPGVDVLKAEFPLNVREQPEEKIWFDACAELSAACPVPWVLLSASVPFEVFLRQVQAACLSGASGVAVGRAVWQEAAGLAGEERTRFLCETAKDRMQQVTVLCKSMAKPWTDFYETPAPDSKWFQEYPAS